MAISRVISANGCRRSTLATHVLNRGEGDGRTLGEGLIIGEGDGGLGDGEGSLGDGEGSLGDGDGSLGEGDGSLGEGDGSLGDGDGGLGDGEGCRGLGLGSLGLVTDAMVVLVRLGEGEGGRTTLYFGRGDGLVRCDMLLPVKSSRQTSRHVQDDVRMLLYVTSIACIAM